MKLIKKSINLDYDLYIIFGSLENIWIEKNDFNAALTLKMTQLWQELKKNWQ